jgi:hypothetical protein
MCAGGSARRRRKIAKTTPCKVERGLVSWAAQVDYAATHNDLGRVLINPQRPWFGDVRIASLKADIPADTRHVRLVPILLQKSFRGGERKFLEPLMRIARSDARDHIVSSKIDHGPS